MPDIPETPNTTVSLIYKAYEDDADTGFRDHLGASGIGHECSRHIWYSFRWMTRAVFSGRMLRLFQTGHLEETRLTADLRRIGVTVQDVDPSTGQQWQVRDKSGHFGGSMDGKAWGFVEAPKTVHVVEYKTHKASSFKDLLKNGVFKSKPMHWAQMQVYMHLEKLTRAFYFAKNKDTDELYPERVLYDLGAAVRLEEKAVRVVSSLNPPERISEDPNWFVCKLCHHSDVCHGRRAPERHCRSCIFVQPAEGGNWLCKKFSSVLTSAAQRDGCKSHRYIPKILTELTQIDAHEHGNWIDYRLRGGTIWRDEGG